jgi:hypothetical protein
MEFEVDYVDVSEHFWPFVEVMISTNGSDDVRMHESYAFFRELIEMAVKIRADVLLQDDTVEGEYTFEDFNKMFYNGRTILRRHRKITLAQKLQQAIDIMCLQIEMDESMADLSL